MKALSYRSEQPQSLNLNTPGFTSPSTPYDTLNTFTLLNPSKPRSSHTGLLGTRWFFGYTAQDTQGLGVWGFMGVECRDLRV